jgi:hypothetical protein
VGVPLQSTSLFEVALFYAESDNKGKKKRQQTSPQNLFHLSPLGDSWREYIGGRGFCWRVIAFVMR